MNFLMKLLVVRCSRQSQANLLSSSTFSNLSFYFCYRFAARARVAGIAMHGGVHS
jgi:hypothetical protein